MATPTAVTRVWLLHLACFVVPLATLGFLITGPHVWWQSLPWTAVIVASVFLDIHSRPELRQPDAGLPRGPFDAVLLVLTLLQLVNIGLLARMASLGGFWRVDTLMVFVLVGVNSGYSGIVVAHELIHRPERRYQWLGRLLLCTVMYEHFYTEHVRGHHVRVGTPDDPATARFGESFNEFWKRTVPAQFKSAWRLEAKRLGDEDMSPFDTRQLGNRVLHGLLAELSLAGAIGALFGLAALGLFLLQAATAIRLLEAVNYFEHWGLTRRGRKVTPIDSWDTDSRFTMYTLVGLSRHADHHAHATRPFQELRHFQESPKLPRGYFGMVVMVILNNARFQKLMTEELERRHLGPFAEPAVEPAPAE